MIGSGELGIPEETSIRDGRELSRLVHVALPNLLFKEGVDMKAILWSSDRPN
jgi:hypothetical protein